MIYTFHQNFIQIFSMKKTILIITLTILAFTGNAQNTVAKIKYEQAEEAFEKSDYANVLVKLDEAQKILGSANPKILYLRLMATKGIVASGKFDWNFLETARKDAAYYIKQYSEMEGIEEKFRQVYEFSETLETLPKTKELFAQKETKAAERLAQWLKERPVQVSDSLMNVFKVKKCATVQEFKNYNPGAFSGLKKFKHPTPSITAAYNKDYDYTREGPSDIYFNDKGLQVYIYTVLGKTADTATAKRIYHSFVDLYPASLDTSVVERVELKKDEQGNETGRTVIKPPATGNKGSIMIFYFGFLNSIYIQIYFNPQ